MDGGCGCVTAFIKLTFLKLRDAAYALQMTGSPRYASSEHRGSPRYASSEHKGLIQGEMLLSKLGEVCESVKVRTFIWSWQMQIKKRVSGFLKMFFMCSSLNEVVSIP
jgi:hypothetical protein